MPALASLPVSPDREAAPTFSMDQVPTPLIVTERNGRILHINLAAELAFGERLIGRRFSELFSGSSHGSNSIPPSGPFCTLTFEDGSLYQVCTGSLQEGLVVSSLFPMTDQTKLVADLDELTGLLKRNGLLQTLSSSLSQQDAGDRQLIALLFLDLDRFKLINDTLGHAVGDLLLSRVVERIRSACRQARCIARVGGDEFVVMLPCANEAEAKVLAERLVDLVGRTYVLSGHTINIGVSIGISFGSAGDSARDLLRNSDLALYEAKREGRGRYRVFQPEMDEALRRRRELEIDLRRALALKQFELHYQPFVDLQTDRITGCEALIRWYHPTRGLVSPADFIPLAEETGLITKIGEWVLRTACQTAAGWEQDITVAVNVSPMQFRASDLVQTVVSTLAYTGLAASRLELEITEGALLDDTPNVLKTLHSLRELGVRISMDDFGTGYSSLSYLQKFPFHKIKIDRSFVQGAETGSESEAILKAIAGLGTSLGMSITAEGVETEEQLERIKSERCTHVQGYFTGRPLPADRLFPNSKPQDKRP